MTNATAFFSEYQFSLIDLQAYREERRKQLMRRHPRRPVNTRAIAHAGIASKAVTISDISNGGLCISGAEGLFPGMEVTVSLVTGLSRVGTVRWWLAGNCGLQFEKPLAADDEFFADVIKRSKPVVNSDQRSGEPTLPIALVALDRSRCKNTPPIDATLPFA